MTDTVKCFPHKPLFCHGRKGSFLPWKEVHFGFWNPYEIRVDIWKMYFPDILKHNFWNIWKNTNRSVVTLFFPTIFFIQGTHLRFLNVYNVFSIFNTYIYIYIYIYYYVYIIIQRESDRERVAERERQRESIQQEINFFCKSFLNYISTLKYCYS